MKPDLQAGITEKAVRLDRLRDPVAPPVVLEYPVIQMLDADLDLRHPHLKHPVDMLLATPVRPRLKRYSDAPDPGPLVCGEYRIEIRPLRHHTDPGVVVHRLHRSTDEPLLVLDRPGGHRPAHDDQLGLIDVVAERLKLPETRLHLVVGVKRMLPRPERRRFLPGVALGGGERVLRPARAGQALPVRAGVGGCHRGDRRNTRERPGRLHEEDRAETLALLARCAGENCRVFRHINAVFPADLELDPLDIGI